MTGRKALYGIVETGIGWRRVYDILNGWYVVHSNLWQDLWSDGTVSLANFGPILQRQHEWHSSRILYLEHQ
jgi:hypothetical protein